MRKRKAAEEARAENKWCTSGAEDGVEDGEWTCSDTDTDDVPYRQDRRQKGEVGVLQLDELLFDRAKLVEPRKLVGVDDVHHGVAETRDVGSR